MRMPSARTKELLLLTKSPEVIEEIFKLNKGLVGKQLMKFGLVGDPDAISLGYEALYNAILTFNTSRNNTFSTYATVCIYNKLGTYVRSKNTMIRMNTISYDNCIDEDGTTHLDTFESSLTTDELVLQKDSIAYILKCVDECINSIKNPTQRKILLLWRETGFEATHKEIATKLACSQSYVSQTLNKFRKKLKSKMGAY